VWQGIDFAQEDCGWLAGGAVMGEAQMVILTTLQPFPSTHGRAAVMCGQDERELLMALRHPH